MNSDIIYDARKDFLRAASLLGDYQSMSVNELADGYCRALDVDDDGLKSSYISALILRFWFKIEKIYQKIKTANMDHSDALGILIDGITQACDKSNRAWQSNSKLNAQQIINQIIATRGVAAVMYESNLQKNKANYNTMSIDAPLNTYSDDTLADVLASDEPEYSDEAEGIIQEFIDQDKLVEAIIMDLIAFRDPFKHDSYIVNGTDVTGADRKYTKYESEFWPYRLVQELNTIGPSYTRYFTGKYKVATKPFKAAISSLTKAPNNKKYKFIEASIRNMRSAFFGA